MLGIGKLFLNPLGLWSLLVLIPFIVFYIIKPKPKKVIIPSLMFFIKDRAQSNFNSFLQKFFKDFLFFVQFIVLILLALAIAKPYLTVPSISYVDSIVFVIDGSASMSALEDGSTRFERAMDIALDRVEGKNTIILATDRGQLLLENGGSKEAIEIFESLKSRETLSANFYDSIVLAENFAKTDNSAVLVLSDFSIDRVEEDFLKGKLYLESKGIDVFFEDVSRNKAKNVGIIDLEVKDLESTVWIKNFNENTETFTLTYGEKKEAIRLEGHDVTSLTVTTQPGTSTIEIDVKDDFELDNYAYISAPEQASMEVMIITNEEEKYLTTALKLMDKVSINIQKPPIVLFGNPDVIILGNINKNVIIPGDISKVKKLANEQGIPVIILAQDGLLDLDLGSMFPLELIKKDPVSISDIAIPTQVNSYLTPAEIQFGQVRQIYEASGNENVIVYAETSKNKYPLITLSAYGRGRILYYGLFDDYSDFKADIFYPIFWKRALDVLIGGKTIGEINKQTGYLQIVGKEQVVDTPGGKRTGKAITLDYTGFYKFKDYTIAANLMSEEEQRLNKDSISVETSELVLEADKIRKETKEKELTILMVIIIGVLLLFELIYIKFRGDV